MKKSKEIIERITGQEVKFFRPPFGQYNEDTLEAVSQLGMKLVMWNISSYDWNLKSEPEIITNNITEHIQDHSIILLHELEQTLTILPSVIKHLKEKGYHFTTI
ncbi:polysaccharide deacetylase [Halalkalibacter akibai JCM 9157]|uniref:Polysaccharide deacetylase n=1 Tax=Halalkalibacter akibai (strain ATCC 43226 / DSM 21942 / CIP 109018 / JCM 9157 / 1139) TaxID=1236973 RepID=W4QQL8_HALA3|nr:polysaccharide deacetylase [Halalkalibacter akibai JCM 9157]